MVTGGPICQPSTASAGGPGGYFSTEQGAKCTGTGNFHIFQSQGRASLTQSAIGWPSRPPCFLSLSYSLGAGGSRPGGT